MKFDNRFVATLLFFMFILPTAIAFIPDYSEAESTTSDGVIYYVEGGDHVDAVIDYSVTLTEIRIRDTVTISGDEYPTRNVLPPSDTDYNETITKVVLDSKTVKLTGLELEPLKALDTIQIPDDSAYMQVKNNILMDKQGGILCIPNALRTGTLTLPNDTKTLPNYSSYGNVSGFSVSNIAGLLTVDDAGALYNKAKTRLFAFPGQRDQSSINVPNTVTVINDYAFNDCRYLKNITLPDELTIIPKNVFMGTYLESVHLSGSASSGLVILPVDTNIEAQIDLSVFHGSTITIQKIDKTTLSDDVKTTLGDSQPYRISADVAGNFTIAIDRSLFNAKSNLYSVSPTGNLTKLDIVDDGSGILYSTVNSNSMIAIIGEKENGEGPAPAPATVTDDPFIPEQPAIIATVSILTSTTIIGAAYVVLKGNGVKELISIFNSDILGLFRYKDKRKRHGDFKINLIIILALLILPIIEGVVLYTDANVVDIFPISYEIDTALWTSFIIVFEGLFACILLNYSYNRMHSHSLSDKDWRESIINKFNDSETDPMDLKQKDIEISKKERFHPCLPSFFVLISAITACLFVLFYHKITLTDAVEIPVIGQLPWASFLPAFIFVAAAILTYPKLILFIPRHERNQQEFIMMLSSYPGFEGIPQFSQKRTIHPAVHVFLLIITVGIYSFLNIMMSIHDTNRHIKEQDNCSKWLSFSSEKDIQTYSRMPLILSVIEIFLLILCAEYVFDLFGYGQDMFNYITGLEGPVNLLDSELIRNAAIVIINVIFLKSAFESVISVPRRSPGSRYSILDTCFKFIFSQIVSLYLMNSDSMNQVFRYSTYIPIAITCAFILWILLSKKVRIYYGWSDGKVV